MFNDLPNMSKDGHLACNRHILGRCSAPGRRCFFVHVAGSELDDTFVNDMCAVISPGIKKLMNEQRAPDGTGGGQG